MKTRIVWLTMITAAASLAAESHFGLVTIGSIDTARLTVYCDDDGSATPTPCDITLEFHDSRGTLLKQTSMTLQIGTSGWLDFQPPAGPDTVGIDPCWTVLRGIAMASLEVFDIFSQRTRILINWGDQMAPRMGDVDFGLVGITPLDTVRLGAFCTADGSVMPPPCDITFNFSDTQGRTIKQSEIILPAGASGFLDLKWAEIGATSRRVEISPCWKNQSGTVALGAAVGSLAVLDNFTGLTIAQSYPAAGVSVGQ
jgi:hypothetical protein